jgi:hypothetical protein
MTDATETEESHSITLPLSCFEEVFRWYPDMRGYVKIWCNENLQSPPTFRKEDREYYADFQTDVDAIFFKLRWVG